MQEHTEEFKWEEECAFSELLGKTLVLVERRKGVWGEDAIVFKTDAGEKFMLSSPSNCWNPTWLEDVCGDLQDLVGKPILLAEEVTNVPGDERPASGPSRDPSPVGYTPEACTWTFYKLVTNAGAVTIRWYGEFEGSYSLKVLFCRCAKEAN